MQSELDLGAQMDTGLAVARRSLCGYSRSQTESNGDGAGPQD